MLVSAGALEANERMHRLAFEIADEAARAEIEAHCRRVLGVLFHWYVVRERSMAQAPSMRRAVEYLTLRGLLVPNENEDGRMVRFTEPQP